MSDLQDASPNTHTHARQRITPTGRSVPWSCSHLAGLLFSALHPSPLGELESGASPTRASFLPRARTLLPRNRPILRPRGAVRSAHPQAPFSEAQLPHYAMDVTVTPPRLNDVIYVKCSRGTGLVPRGLPSALSLSRLCLAKKMRPPSPQSIKGASPGFVPLKQASFPSRSTWAPEAGLEGPEPLAGPACPLPGPPRAPFNRTLWAHGAIQ